MEKRGRARSERARTAVLTATRELVAELGYAHVTIEKIAARAGVGKPTIYRWWQSKNAILAECVLAGDMLPTPVAEDGIRVSAGEWFREVLAYLDENAPLLRGLVAAAYEDPDMALQLRAHLADPIEVALTEWALAAGTPGDASPEMSPGALAQLLFGAVLYRLVAGGDRVDDSGDDLFDVLLARFLRAEEAPPAP